MDKKTEKQLVELWGKVGFIVNLSQMVEYNLANILGMIKVNKKGRITSMNKFTIKNGIQS